MTDSDENTLTDQQQHIEALERDLAIERTSRLTGVPPDLLGNGNTAEEIEQIAADLLAWKAAAPPAQPPATAAAPAYTVGQISRSTLQYLSPEQISAVHREGRLEGIGAPAPPPRRTGEQHRNAAP